MDKNGWIVVGIIAFFGLTVFVVNLLLSKKPPSDGAPQPGVTTVEVSDEVKNKSATDTLLNPQPFLPVSFGKAMEVAKKISPVFQGQEWFGGMRIQKDEKYGRVLEFVVFPGEIKFTPSQLSILLSIGEMYGVHVRLCEQEGMGVALNQKPFSISFEKADAVSEKVAKIFGGENGQEWFAGTWAPEDEKYGHVVELRMYSEALKLTPDQLQYFPDSKEVDGVQIHLSIIEGGVPVPFKKKIDK